MKSVILTPRSGVMQIRESRALREPRFHPPGRMFRKARTSPGREGPESLRVFGCLPVTVRGAARRQASEKPRRRKPRGEYAPAAVSVYGDLRRGSARLGCSRTEVPG